MRKVTQVLALVFVFLLTNQAKATEAGKIYVSGKWVKIEQSAPTISVPPIFGSILSPSLGVNLEKIARNFLAQNASLLRTNSAVQWDLTQAHEGSQLQSQRLAKRWNGLEVVGGDAVVHLKQGSVVLASADNTDLSQLSPQAKISPEEAQALAFASYRGRAYATEAPALKVLLLGKGSERQAKLIYEITVRDRDQLSSDVHSIDAETGAELQVSSNVHTLVSRHVMAGFGSEIDFERAGSDSHGWDTVYSENGCGERDYFFERTPSPSEPCVNLDARVMSSALSAWNHSKLVHDFYLNKHGRRSIDGKGMTLNSVVNFGGQGFPNAAWYDDRSLMLYGIGDEHRLNDFASSLDVAAHEITHGITSRTANLEYADESGALNESYSDVFGKLVAFEYGKANDWKLGREIFRDGVSFVRDMENPKVAHTNDYKFRGEVCGRDNDFCGVHVNSGIPNRAAVLLSKKIGLKKLGEIYYLTLTQLLRSSSDFQEARAQTEAACKTLYGELSLDCNEVSEAFAAVGI